MLLATEPLILNTFADIFFHFLYIIEFKMINSVPFCFVTVVMGELEVLISHFLFSLDCILSIFVYLFSSVIF